MRSPTFRSSTATSPLAVETRVSSRKQMTGSVGALWPNGLGEDMQPNVMTLSVINATLAAAGLPASGTLTTQPNATVTFVNLCGKEDAPAM